EEDKAKAAGSDAERRGLKRQRDEKDEHGRAYYEFREEAYNSRSKSPPPPEEEPREGEDDETVVILDTYTSDLHFKASKDRYGGQPLFFERFPALWSGARGTHGVTQGKVCFEAKVTQHLPGKEGSTEGPLLRVGWSVDFSRSQLGEDEFSFGYDGRGLKVEAGRFEEFGEPFGESDVIGCFADFDAAAAAVELSFSKNGRVLGVAFQVSKEALARRALLPHVLCRGCAVELNFGQKEAPAFPAPPGFVFVHAVPPAERVRTPLPPRTTEECEVLLMVGLPGSGKTQWARKHTEENREKRYNILGTETVLQQMRVGAPRSPPLPSVPWPLGSCGFWVPHSQRPAAPGIPIPGTPRPPGSIGLRGLAPLIPLSVAVGGQRRGYDNRLYGQQQYWGQPGNRGGYRNFYDRYRGDYDRFYGRDYEYNRYRDYYRQYNREWQNYYQDRDRYYRNYYGYQGYR
ncbi:HNRL2 protein, partial [Nothoprocta ornata]|nr:HNRL2 protein [Nothoprocta ornata]